MSLNGRLAVVTGAKRGIGKAIALKLAENGADIVVLDLDIEDGDAILKEARAFGRKAWGVQLNVADEKTIPPVVDKVLSECGKIDILVNNAGIYPATPLLDISVAEWDRVYNINTRGLFFMSQAVAKKAMVPAKKGVIINIASCDAKVPSWGITHYASSKAAVVSITKSLCIELSEYKIRTNCVAPGWVATETVMKSDRWKSALESIPSGRLADMSEIGDAVVFLVSDLAGYINGETLDVNGGVYLD